MKVFINNYEIIVFNGATVLDAVRAFYVHHNKKPPCILPIVNDKYGNFVAYDGQLTEKNHLYLRIF